MSLNRQDKNDIKEILDVALKNIKVPVGNVWFTTGQVFGIIIALIFALLSFAVFVLSISGKINEVNIEVASLIAKLDERLPPKQSTSTDTHSPTPQKATDDSAKPE